MVQTVAVIGAGGKMGARAVEKLTQIKSYKVLAYESDGAKAKMLEAQGFRTSSLDEALPSADFVILAVPDALIGRIARQFVPRMKKDATLIMLDAAAAYINDLPDPGPVTLMLTHPCHPAFFVEQATPEARADYFGGTAIQDIIVSFVHGSEKNFEAAVKVCKAMFGPVRNAHRVTPEQAALLEPAMAELVVATAACLMKASLEAAIEAGVPESAARAFIAGHARIATAIAFGAEKSPFSDACKIAIEWGTREIIRPDWKKVFEPKVLREAIHAMLEADSTIAEV
jgi:D-apionate oxidoisomerase